MAIREPVVEKGFPNKGIRAIISGVLGGKFRKEGDLDRVNREGSVTARELSELRRVREDITKTFKLGSVAELRRFYQNEDIFRVMLTKLRDKIPEEVDNTVDRGKLSDVITLHYLLVGGKLDELYKDYLNEIGLDPKSVSKDEMIDAKIELGLSFIQTVRDKNGETKAVLQAPELPITQGMEIEYSDIVIEALNEYELYKMLLAQEMVAVFAGMPVDDIAKGRDLPKDTELMVAYFKKLAKAIYGEKIPGEYHSERFSSSLEYDAKNYGHVITAIEDALGFYKTPIEVAADGSGLEVETLPSASYKTQLREALMVHLSGGIGGEMGWNVHETLGGIDLTPEHTEFMDVMLIGAAAGLVGLNVVREGEGGTIEETDGKVSNVSAKYSPNGSIYFPFHKRRNAGPLKPYYRGYDDHGIEQRGVLKYSLEEFPLMVRFMRFSNRSAYAVKSVQKDLYRKSDFDKELMEVWKQSMANWEQLLEQAGVAKLEPDEYYGHKSRKYNELFTQLVAMAAEDEEFKYKARGIIRELNAAVTQILNNAEDPDNYGSDPESDIYD